MRASQVIVAGISVVQVVWGAAAFVEYARSVGGGASPGAAWVATALGASGLAALFVPRFGYVAAAGQLAAATYAAWWCGVALVLMHVGAVLPILPQVVLALILTFAGTAAVLCGLNAVAAWQVARHREIGSGVPSVVIGN